MNLKQQAVELYLSGFPEDSREFATSFIEKFFDTNCCYIEENGILISMLFMFDSELIIEDKRLPTSYIYAVVTHPKLRGKGFMTKLMQKAKLNAKEKSALIIKPSNRELYSFYERFGFKTVFYFKEQEYIKREDREDPITFADAISYNTKREELLNKIPHIFWGNMMEYIGSNGRFFIGKDFCGLLETIDERLFLREFLGDKKGLDALLCSLSKQNLVVRTAEYDEPFGMLCPLKDIQLQNKMYMGFAMD